MSNNRFSKEVYYDLTILIATKDRLSQLTKLLISIENSTILPGTVIIVYHGTEIESYLKKFNASFDIQIVKSDIASQVFQKQLGLRSLSSNCEWVFFLDDDVIIESNSIEFLYKKYICNPDFSNYGGFGLAIKNRVYTKHKKLTEYLLYLIKLHSFSPGDVTKGGHPQLYLNQHDVCDVKWLNGVSIWARKVTNQYFNVPIISEYAAYEDVAFSFNVNKNFKLAFACDVFVLDQILESNKPLTSKQFIAGCYARYCFVDLNPGMSKIWLIAGQIVRNIDFIVRSSNEENYFGRIQLTLKLFLDLLLLSSGMSKRRY